MLQPHRRLCVLLCLSASCIQFSAGFLSFRFIVFRLSVIYRGAALLQRRMCCPNEIIFRFIIIIFAYCYGCDCCVLCCSCYCVYCIELEYDVERFWFTRDGSSWPTPDEYIELTTDKHTHPSAEYSAAQHSAAQHCPSWWWRRRNEKKKNEIEIDTEKKNLFWPLCNDIFVLSLEWRKQQPNHSFVAQLA